MDLFFRKKNKAIDIFSTQLAESLYEKIPCEIAVDYFDTKKISEKSKKEITRELNNAIHLVNQFRSVNKLGVYGKARLHLKFMDRLKELGYDSKVAEKMNKTILLRTP